MIGSRVVEPWFAPRSTLPHPISRYGGRNQKPTLKLEICQVSKQERLMANTSNSYYLKQRAVGPLPRPE